MANTRKGVVYLSKDKTEITFGEQKLIPLSQIEYNRENNRRKYKQHVSLMKKKIREYGFLGVIVVFKSTKKDHLGNPIYNPAEGNHRTDALHELFGVDRNDVKVPCLVLPFPEYNADDRETALEVIIGLNKDNKAWTIMDYIQGWSKTKRQDYINLETEIRNNRTKAPYLTPALTSYIYAMGKSSTDTKTIQDGKLKVSVKHRPYVSIMLDTMRDWTNEFGVKKWQLHPTFSANFIVDAYSFLKSDLLPLVEQGRMDSSDSVLIFEEWIDTVHNYVSNEIGAVEDFCKRKNMTKPKEIRQLSEMFLPTATLDIKNALDELREKNKFDKLIKKATKPTTMINNFTSSNGAAA